ncbi:MAG: tRNA (adenosine(37)-N6)-dimethylallyltransferase MiaA, partial [Candidatus Riflebacteria bacterium]
MNDSHKIKVIAVLGPTASGKSSLAIDMATHFGGAILNCDSRQVYRGMDIGTAKPGAREKALVEHHLFDLIDPDTTFSAGDYKTAAAQAITGLKSRKIVPVLVGGTGFYYSAIAEGLPPASSDPQTVQLLQQICENEGIEALQKMLKEKDPQAFSAIDLNNSRRVMRALEIVMVTGRPFAQNQPIKALPEADFLPIVVTRPRDILHSRIEIRVKEMFDLGLKTEAQELFAKF